MKINIQDFLQEINHFIKEIYVQKLHPVMNELLDKNTDAVKLRLVHDLFVTFFTSQIYPISLEILDFG